MLPLMVAVSVFATVTLLVVGVFNRQTAAAGARARLSALAGGYGDIPIWLEPDLLRSKRGTHLPLLEMLIERRSWASRLELDLARAATPLRVAEYVLLRIAGGVVFGFTALLLTGSPIYALPAAIVGYLLPRLWLAMKRNKRLSKLNKQLPEAIQLISSSLKAGFALLQAFEAAADRVPDPMGSELKRTIRDLGLGANMDEAVTAWGQRIPGPDLEIIINAIMIQRTVGGNLGEILDNVGHTMRERERLYGEIRALTAQQRMSGLVIGCLPVAVGVLLFIINPTYMSPLFTETVGKIMLAGAVFMGAFSFFLINKILDIDV